MIAILSNVGKISLWLYVIAASGVILVKIAAYAPVRGVWFLESIATTLSSAQLFFIFIVLPLVTLTLWEIWDWDKLLTARKHV